MSRNNNSSNGDTNKHSEPTGVCFDQTEQPRDKSTPKSMTFFRVSMFKAPGNQSAERTDNNSDGNNNNNNEVGHVISSLNINTGIATIQNLFIDERYRGKPLSNVAGDGNRSVNSDGVTSQMTQVNK